MKFSAPYLFFLSFLILVTPLYAGTQTITTYYPSPSGDYNKMQTNFMKLGAYTLRAVQAEYKCSYDLTAGLPPCPAGIIYYDTDAHTLFFSDGAHWRMAVSSCIPLVACPTNLGCGTDSCGNSCGTCIGSQTCSNFMPQTPGTCT